MNDNLEGEFDDSKVDGYYEQSILNICYYLRIIPKLAEKEEFFAFEKLAERNNFQRFKIQINKSIYSQLRLDCN